MWCIPKLNDEFKERMECLLDLYAERYDRKRPVICLDEKSKQLIADTRTPRRSAPGKTAVLDYEYKRNGTQNIFVAVEPKGGRRHTKVTDRRKKEDYAIFITELIEQYKEADCIRIIQDNLNIHTKKSLEYTFGKRKATQFMKDVRFYQTPKHASWLNMAEIEIGVLEKQCLNRRIATKEEMKKEVCAWTERRNKERRRIKWKFTKKKAENVFPELYVKT